MKNLFLGFAGLVTAVSVWSIWGGDMFPAPEDPNGDPEKWTEDELKRWLNAVSEHQVLKIYLLTFRERGLFAGSTATKEELLARVKANMRAPRT
jgi:hypothetical protein